MSNDQAWALIGVIVVSNIGLIVSGFLNFRDRLSKVEYKICRAEKDINNLGAALRSKK